MTIGGLTVILSVRDVHKSYRKEKVLCGISFEIEAPEIIALIGPNGAGKTTLLNIMTNLLPADRGNVSFFSKKHTDPNIFKDIAFMQDNSVLYHYLTGYDHLQFIGDIQNIPKHAIMETAELVGIDHYLHKKVQQYSQGMKQHLLLTMALINDPKLLILDEPFNGMDPTSAIKARNLLLTLAKEGKTILLSSHILSEIDRLTSHILFLKDGKLIKEDISNIKQLVYLFTVDQVDKAEQALEKAHIPFQRAEHKLAIQTDDAELQNIIQHLINSSIAILDIEKKEHGSEDRYQAIFGSEGDHL